MPRHSYVFPISPPDHVSVEINAFLAIALAQTSHVAKNFDTLPSTVTCYAEKFAHACQQLCTASLARRGSQHMRSGKLGTYWRSQNPYIPASIGNCKVVGRFSTSACLFRRLSDTLRLRLILPPASPSSLPFLPILLLFFAHGQPCGTTPYILSMALDGEFVV